MADGLTQTRLYDGESYEHTHVAVSYGKRTKINFINLPLSSIFMNNFETPLQFSGVTTFEITFAEVSGTCPKAFSGGYNNTDKKKSEYSFHHI